MNKNYLFIFAIIFVLVQGARAQDFFVSPSLIEVSMRVGSTQQGSFTITSQVNTSIKISLSDSLRESMTLNKTEINATTEEKIDFLITPKETNAAIKTGIINIVSPTQEQEIPILLIITPKRKIFDANLNLPQKRVFPSQSFEVKLEMVNLGNFKPILTKIRMQIKNLQGNIIQEKIISETIDKEKIISHRFTIPQTAAGVYRVEAEIQSEFSTEHAASFFRIGETTNEEEQTARSWIYILAIIILILFIGLGMRAGIKSTFLRYILIFIVLGVLITILSLNVIIPKSQEQEYQKTTVQGNNFTKQLSIADLTREEFLKNMTDHFVIYIINSSQREQQKPTITSDRKNLLISFDTVKLEITKAGRKYVLSIIQKNTEKQECNFICLWKTLFLTETSILLLIVLFILIYTQKKQQKEKPQEQSNTNMLSQAEITLVKNPFVSLKLLLIHILQIEYEPTLEQLQEEIKQKNLTKKFKESLITFLGELNEMYYSNEKKTKKAMKSLARDLFLQLKAFYENQYKDENTQLKKEVKE